MKNISNFPSTRYQGSKYKLLSWLETIFKDLDFNSAFDIFSGTSSVSYLFKTLNKKVYSNDFLLFNSIVSKALIQNNNIFVEDSDIDFIFKKHIDFNYLNFIENNFKDIYYTTEENILLDIIVQNILSIKNELKQAALFWILFQACISKRPYNLFHRKNLYVRTADVSRSFGNKTTWDKSFYEHFIKFTKEFNNAIFNNSFPHKNFNEDVFDLNVPNDLDLVYLDSPYIPKKGSVVKYQDFYHFLNGMVDYYNWDKKIDFSSKNLKFKTQYSVWEDKKNISSAFINLFKKFSGIKYIVVSYRLDGIPSIEELSNYLIDLNYNVEIHYIDYSYVFSKKKQLKEVLIVACKK